MHHYNYFWPDNSQKYYAVISLLLANLGRAHTGRREICQWYMAALLGCLVDNTEFLIKQISFLFFSFSNGAHACLHMTQIDVMRVQQLILVEDTALIVILRY